jgi:serine/threonine protein kinase
MNTLAPTPEQAGSADQALGVLIDELTCRLQAGQVVDVPAFLAAHPEHAKRLQQLLPALQMLADVGRSPAAGSGEGLLPAEAADPMIGTLGDFRLLREVGRGGMGVDYEAVQISLGRRVALKVLPFAAALDGRQLQRFKNEAQAAAHLHHTHIVPVYGVGCERGVHYYAMQFIDGRTLAAMIHELRQTAGLEGPPTERLAGPAAPHDPATGPWAPGQGAHADPQPTGPHTPPPSPATVTQPAAPLTSGSSTRGRGFFRTAAHLGVQAAEALEHAHQLGVVHRDIKPANLLVETSSPLSPLGTAPGGEGLRLWITDFGLAHCQDQAGLTMTGDLVGTLRYMSPEQVLAKRVPVDHRTDVYSLGVTLYELLTLRPAFAGSNRPELLRQIAFEEPRPPRQHDRAIPAELETIVLKALEKNPAERYATAQELADDLQRYLNDEPIRARRPTVLHRVRKWARRHRSLVVTVTSAVMILLVSAVVILAFSNVRINQEKGQKEAQQQRAQDNLRLALQALDGIYLQVAEVHLPRDPQRKKEDRVLLQKALDFYHQFADKNSNDPSVRREVSQACRRVGDIQSLIGDPVAAAHAYGSAIAAAAELSNQFPTEPEYARDLAVALSRLAEVLVQTGDLPGGADHCHQAVGRLAALTASWPTVPEYRAELARSHHGLGKLLKRQGERRAADEAFQQALDIQSQLTTEFPTVSEYRAGLADIHLSVGSGVQGTRLDDPPGERAHIHEARRILSALVADDPKPVYRHKLAMTLQVLGSLPGYYEPRADYLKQAIDLLIKLGADFPQVPDYRNALALCLNRCGELYWMKGDWDTAAKYYGQDLDVRLKLAGDYPDSLPYQHLSVARFNWARVLVYRGEFGRARQLLHAALSQSQASLKAHPKNERWASQIVCDNYLLAGIAAVLDRAVEAAKKRQEAEQLLSATWRRLRTVQGSVSAANFLADIAIESKEFGEVWQKRGDHQEAARVYEFALSAQSQALELDKSNTTALRHRHFMYEQLWQMYKQLQQWERARDYLRQAMAFHRQLVAQHPEDARYRCELAYDCCQLAALSPSTVPPREADGFLKEALALAQKLVTEKFPVAGYRVRLGHCLWQSGSLLAATSRPQEAEQAFRQALAVFDQLATDFPKVGFYRQEAAYTCWSHLGPLLSGQPGRAKEADEVYRQGIVSHQKLVADFPGPDPNYHDRLAGNYDALINHLRSSKREQQIPDVYRDAIAFYEPLRAKRPHDASVAQNLAGRHSQLGQMLLASKQPAEALHSLRQVVAIRQQLVADHADNASYRQALALAATSR